MVWRRTGDKLSYESMFTKLYDVIYFATGPQWVKTPPRGLVSLNRRNYTQRFVICALHLDLHVSCYSWPWDMRNTHDINRSSLLDSCLKLRSFMWELTHWGRVTQICVSKVATIGWDNGLSPGRRQAIIWTNAGILLIRTSRTNLFQGNFKRNS